MLTMSKTGIEMPGWTIVAVVPRSRYVRTTYAEAVSAYDMGDRIEFGFKRSVLGVSEAVARAQALARAIGPKAELISFPALGPELTGVRVTR